MSTDVLHLPSIIRKTPSRIGPNSPQKIRFHSVMSLPEIPLPMQQNYAKGYTTVSSRRYSVWQPTGTSGCPPIENKHPHLNRERSKSENVNPQVKREENQRFKLRRIQQHSNGKSSKTYEKLDKNELNSNNTKNKSYLQSRRSFHVPANVPQKKTHTISSPSSLNETSQQNPLRRAFPSLDTPSIKQQSSKSSSKVSIPEQNPETGTKIGTEVAKTRKSITTLQYSPYIYPQHFVYRKGNRLREDPRIQSTDGNPEQTRSKSSGYPRSQTLKQIPTRLNTTPGSPRHEPMASLKEIQKYRETAIVYLDTKWKNARNRLIYSYLEAAEIKQWKGAQMMAKQHMKRNKESKERQCEQLRFVREKHQNIRNRRLNTQHVKWKYVLDGKEGDRKEYGLPSEYYTYYGFESDDQGLGEKSKSAISHKSSAKARSISKVNTIKELKERIRNRYDYMLQAKPDSQLDHINKILKKGTFTIEASEKDPAQSRLSAEEKTKLKTTTKQSPSKLVVRDVINDAKRALEAHGDAHSYSSAAEDSES